LSAELNRPVYWLAGAALILGACGLAVARERARRRMSSGGRLIRLLAPPQVDPAGAVTLWTNLIALLRPGYKRSLFGQPHLTFELTADSHGLEFRIWVPGMVPPGMVERAAEAAWPGARTTTHPASPPIHHTATATGGRLRLARNPAYPLATDHPADPLRPLLGALAGIADNQRAVIQLAARPVTGRRLTRLRTTTRRRSTQPHTNTGRGSSTVPDPFRAGELAAMTAKAISGGYAAELRYTIATLTPPPGDRTLARREAAVRRGQAHAIASAFAAYSGLNHLTRTPLRQPLRALAARRLGRGQLLSITEIAALAHLPLDDTVPGLARAGARAVAAPPAIPTLPAQHPSGSSRNPADPHAASGMVSSSPPAPAVEAGKLLGVTEAGRRVMLPVADSRQHLHVMGATGAGKSTLLTNLILDDIAAGRGVAVIDPKGDLITDLLDRIPTTAAHRIALLDPDPNHPGGPATVAVNPLDGPDMQLAVDHLVGIFRRIYAGFWGPRTDDVLRSGCLTLLTYTARTGQPISLLDLPALLTDPVFRKRITSQLHDPGGLGGFWTAYEQLGDGGRSQMIGPLLNKLRAFLLRDFVRTTVTGQAGTQGPAAAAVLSGGILLARLPKGQLGDDTSRLLGSFLVAQIWQAATHQTGRAETDRLDASLYVDECHNFLTLPRSFDEVLAEARGYRLSLVLAHQHLGQLPPELRAAISANARNKLLFAVSPEDAHTLARHTLPELSGHDLAHLPAFTAAARLVIASNYTPAFTLRTRPAAPAIPGRAALLRAHAAARQSPPPPPSDDADAATEPLHLDASVAATPIVRTIAVSDESPAGGEAAAPGAVDPSLGDADLIGGSS
jgi:hypothetical protein